MDFLTTDLIIVLFLSVNINTMVFMNYVIFRQVLVVLSQPSEEEALAHIQRKAWEKVPIPLSTLFFHTSNHNMIIFLSNKWLFLKNKT